MLYGLDDAKEMNESQNDTIKNLIHLHNIKSNEQLQQS